MRNFFIFFLMLALSYSANAEVKVTGAVQINAKSGEGTNGNSTDPTTDATSGLRFGAGHVRLAAAFSKDNSFGKLMLKMDGGTLATPIYLGFVGHKFNYGFLNSITAGIFKNPLGMEFNVGSLNQDVVEFSPVKYLSGGTVTGAMLKGELGFGLSYDLALYNSQMALGAGDTIADSADNNVGEAFGKALKLAYDRNAIHFQVGYAMDEDARDEIAGNPNYASKKLDIGATYKANNLKIMAEFLTSKDELTDIVVADSEELTQTAMYFHVGYKFMKNMEAVVRYSTGKYEYTAGGTTIDATLSNINLGLNIWGNDTERLQVNYILAGGDKRGEVKEMQMSGLYDADALVAVYQIKF